MLGPSSSLAYGLHLRVDTKAWVPSPAHIILKLVLKGLAITNAEAYNKTAIVIVMVKSFLAQVPVGIQLNYGRQVSDNISYNSIWQLMLRLKLS
jgi:hypothetical protein